MASANTASSLHQLSTICDDNLSLHAKIGLVTISKPYPSPIYEKILLSIEYLQLFTPLLISALSFQHSQETWLPNVLYIIAKLLNPGYWISFSQFTPFNITLLIIIVALTASKLLIYFYLAYKLAHNLSPPQTIVKIWKVIFRFQGRITYFYLTSFFVNALTASEGHYLNKPFMIPSIVFITLEFSFSMFLTISYKYLLPTKHFLSAKNNQLEILTLLQKLILQLFMIFVPSNSWIWVFPIFNCLCDRIRQFCFMKILPLYNFQALTLQGHILVVLTSFNLACLTLAIIKSVDQNSCSLLVLIILWLMFGGFLMKVCKEFLKEVFWKIVADSSVVSPGLLIHRIPLIKQLIRQSKEKSLDENGNSNWTLLLYQTLNKNLSNILKISSSPALLSLQSKTSVDQLFKHYLEKLIEMHPKDQLTKLYAAKFFAKKFSAYGESVKMAKHIKNNGNFLMTLQAEYIFIEIQNQIRKQAQQHQFSPFQYIQEQTFLAKLKLQILKQANLQIYIYDELKKTTPSLVNILRNSQKLKSRRDDITLEIAKITPKISESHIEPFLLFAQYHLILNHSISDYSNFAKIYTRKYQKYFKSFEEESLSHKNLFQNTTGFYFLSGQKSDVGTILLTSKSQLSNTHHMSQRIAPCLRNFYDSFYKSLAEDTNDSHFTKITRGFLYDEDGCLTEVDYCLNIHPHVTQGFYFTLLFRPVISNRDAFYVVENGDIDSTTKKIRDQLGLHYGRQGTIINLQDISEELAIVNHVFNLIAFPDRFSHWINGVSLTKEEANEIYATYTTQGKTLILKSLSRNARQLTYHCRIQNIILDTTVVKTMIFEQIVPKKSQSPIPRKESSEEISFSFDEEKSRGWLLDFQPSLNYRTMNLTQRNLPTDQENIATTTRTLLESSSSSRLKLNGDKSPRTQSKEKPPTRDTPSSSPDPQEIKERVQHPRVQSLTGKSLSSSQFLQRKKLSNVLKKALETPYSSKISRMLISVFYLTLVTLIASQIILSLALNTNTTQLQIKKDILRNFQTRNSLTITVGGSLRALQEVNNGQFNTTGLYLFVGGTQLLKQIADQILSQLSDLNQYLLHNAETIEESIRGLLFKQNIKIYDTYFDESVQVYLNLSTFQATDRIVETGLKLINTEDFTSSNAIQAANIFVRNTANDLIIQNQKIASLFTDLFMSQREKIEKIISVYLYLLTAIFMCTLVVFGILMRRQYIRERKNLRALCQLSNKQIDNVMKSCMKLREEIEDQRSFVESYCFTLKDDERKVTRQKSLRKTPNLKGIKRKYSIYCGKLLMIISLLLSLILSSSIIAKQTIDNLKTEQDQIEFVDYLKTRTSLSMQSYGELLTTNNIALIENRPALDELIELGQELQTVGRDIYSVLLAKDITEQGKASKAFFLGEACDFTDPVLTSVACDILRASGKKTGLIYLFDNLESLITNKLEDYIRSDKSEKARMEIKRSDYNEFVAIYQVLMSGQDDLANLINERLEREIKESRKMREQVLGVFVGVGVILGCLSWICLWRKLKKGVDEFKNVLRVFPAEVIFSNFLLRNFLVKTSKIQIDFIKN